MVRRHDLDCDVLVVGGGIAGARAAIEAATTGARVVLLTKGVFGSGTSVGPVVCAAVGPWAPPGDSIDRHFEGIVVSGRRFLCDQRLARVLAEEAPARLIEVEKYGFFWDRDESGRIVAFPEFSEEVHLPEEENYVCNRFISSNREGRYFGWTGQNLLQALKHEVERMNVQVIEEAMAFRLLELPDGGVAGAIALDYVTGMLLVIRAPSTIVSTGSASKLWYPWGLGPKEGTGDGVAMAYRVGAEIRDIELQMTAYLPSLAPSWSGRHKLMQGAIEPSPQWRPEYRIRWINANGDEFLKGYPPDVPTTYEQLYLKVITAVHTELADGRGPLSMDYSAVPRALLEQEAPFLVRMMEKLGRPEGQYRLEVGPNPMWSFGGVATDEYCHATVDGLFACADASNGPKDGLGASVACGVTTCLVFGARAGRAAAERAREINGASHASLAPVDEEAQRLAALLESSRGVAAVSLKIRLGETMRANMHLKDEASMCRALADIERIRADVPSIGVSSSTRRYNYELVEALEVPLMLDTAEMIVRASLTRKESRRHLFVRRDYPLRDDHEWLRHVVVKREDNRMHVSTVPVEFPYLVPDETGLHVKR
jgi:succinate dehydrogenase/fumarate reductase flavoprotein subunit